MGMSKLVSIIKTKTIIYTCSDDNKTKLCTKIRDNDYNLTIIIKLIKPSLIAQKKCRPGQVHVGFPSGQVTFHSHLSNRQVICQLNC